jgi:hypothetical protein
MFIWTNETGLLVDDVGVIVCDHCPCEAPSASQPPSCLPGCWNFSRNDGFTSNCTDSGDNPIDCQFTMSLVGWPDAICQGDTITLTGTFTNTSADTINPLGLAIGVELELNGTVLTVVSHNGDTMNDGGGSCGIGKTTSLSGGGSVVLTMTFSVDAIGSTTGWFGDLIGGITFGARPIDWTSGDHGLNDEGGIAIYYNHGC